MDTFSGMRIWKLLLEDEYQWINGDGHLFVKETT